ncbi:MAG: DUF481 domain-containing protein [Gemmataceae bacterium]|nr:DUF481 domain-containing protein [Gemmataceae bacterium]
MPAGRTRRAVLPRAGLAVLLAALAGPAAADPPTGPTVPPSPKGPDPYGWPLPAPAKLPEAKVPDAKLPDYFGPATNLPFNEKSLFPTPALPNPPTTQAPPGLPPLPPPDRRVMIPDGSYPPDPPSPPPPPLWKGGVELGVNGSQGNSDVLSLRLGANADRRTERNLFHMDLLYTLSRQDGMTRQDQALLNLRDELLFPGNPYSLFSATQVEYDQFRAYDLQVGSYLGVAYRWVKTDATLFKTRVGAGAVRQMDLSGTAPSRWVPEAVVGGDWNHRFTDRQGFVSSLDVFPNLSQIGQFRVRARAGYEIVLAPEYGMVLRLGVQDRYDSSPGPAKRNDVNYFTTLLFKF